MRRAQPAAICASSIVRVACTASRSATSTVPIAARANRSTARSPCSADQRRGFDDERAAKSRGFLVRIHDTYALANARGEHKRLRELFAPAEPPGGAGDCAAPKLLAYAYRHGLRPLAIAELWCGAPPPTGDRREGMFYPACRGKCGPILTSHARGPRRSTRRPCSGVARSQRPSR